MAGEKNESEKTTILTNWNGNVVRGKRKNFGDKMTKEKKAYQFTFMIGIKCLARVSVSKFEQKLRINE